MHADFLMKNLRGKKILDVGSGPGNYAIYFKEKGFNVTCLDVSQKMVDKCKEKGLIAIKGDIENPPFNSKTFDGVWACAILQHIKRSEVPITLKAISKILKPKGILAVLTFEGKNEGFLEDPDKPKAKRWFTFFTGKEFDKLVEKEFTIIRKNLKNGGLIYFLKKKQK